MRLARLTAVSVGAGLLAGFGAGLLQPRRPELRSGPERDHRPGASPEGAPAHLHPETTSSAAADRGLPGPVM